MVSATKKLKGHRENFKRLVGLNPREFEVLLERLRPLWEAKRNERLNRLNRVRKIGGGGKYRLDLEEQLLMLLMYYRLYVTHEFLGFLFHLDDSNVSRNIRELESLLTQVFRIPQKRISIKNEEITELFIDATEQRIQRPKGKNKMLYYSGKKKAHTLKHQIIIDKQGEIKAVGKTTQGSKHDKKDYQQQHFYLRSPHTVAIKTADSGYAGMPGWNLPHKKKPHKKLTPEQIHHNRQLSKKRILVEHVIGKLKVFKILAERFRLTRHRHNLVFKNIAGIYNMRFQP